MAASLMVYDRTCTHTGRVPLGLSHTWAVGSELYGRLGRFDAWIGAASWAEALGWLATYPAPIASIQFWGHGNWGLARIAREPLAVRSLEPGHPHRPLLEAIRERMLDGPGWWFRICDTLGADAGHTFARRWTDFFGQPVAGHTHVIGSWQSGLHRLQPGSVPHWPATEGLTEGTPAKPVRSAWSTPTRPNTIHCLQSKVPEGW